MKRLLPFIIILGVLGVAVGSVLYMTRTKSAPPAEPGPQSSGQPNPSPSPNPVRTGVPGAEPAHTIGPANAPVHIEEFGDFQCPPCGMFHPVLKQMEQEFGDKIQVTFRNNPLPNHNHAVAAASAAEAAGLQNKFWEMHALIYEHQNEWSASFDARSTFEGYAKQLGLDVERFKRDVLSDRVEQRIYLDGKRARSMNVNSTPTVFINGREQDFKVFMRADGMRGLIQNELTDVEKKK